MTRADWLERLQMPWDVLWHKTCATSRFSTKVSSGPLGRRPFKETSRGRRAGRLCLMDKTKRLGVAAWALVGVSLFLLFGALVLITGPIWARPVWGTWWQWDARLTSTTVMWLTYVGYLFLRNLATDPTRAS